MVQTTSHHVDEVGMVTFLSEPVRVPSVNPSGNAGPLAALKTAKLCVLNFETTSCGRHVSAHS
ncbi:MAG: hypothetical protein AAEC10_00120 [Rhodospirillales bacterium]